MAGNPQSPDEICARLRSILQAVKDPLMDDWDPLEVGLLIAKLEYTDLDIAAQLEHFAAMTKDLDKSLKRELSIREQTLQTLDYFSKTLQFTGDKTNYYNIKNSFVNDVLLRRKGIPISLSLVFMALCRAVKLKSVGIAFPGHFLVRMVATAGHFEAVREAPEDWRNQTYIDSFDGTVLTTQECEKRLREWTRGVVPFGPDVLKIAHPVDIVSRTLRNLRAIFAEKEDLPRLWWVLTALIEVCPADSVEAYRERGLLMGRMGRFRAAAEDFKKYLAMSNDIEKMKHVERLLRFFEGQSEMSN
jgi:regulator of sirC expression with transglutaminase-like and TPR domain